MPAPDSIRALEFELMPARRQPTLKVFQKCKEDDRFKSEANLRSMIKRISLNQAF
jgi:hypothetical protein